MFSGDARREGGHVPLQTKNRVEQHASDGRLQREPCTVYVIIIREAAEMNSLPAISASGFFLVALAASKALLERVLLALRIVDELLQAVLAAGDAAHRVVCRRRVSRLGKRTVRLVFGGQVELRHLRICGAIAAKQLASFGGREIQCCCEAGQVIWL